MKQGAAMYKVGDIVRMKVDGSRLRAGREYTVYRVNDGLDIAHIAGRYAKGSVFFNEIELVERRSSPYEIGNVIRLTNSVSKHLEKGYETTVQGVNTEKQTILINDIKVRPCWIDFSHVEFVSVSTNETYKIKTETETLRDAAIHMQAVVGLVLMNGGLDYDVWFDQLAHAQRNLARAAKITSAEYEEMRKKLKINIK
jgi:hypothetical protein